MTDKMTAVYEQHKIVEGRQCHCGMCSAWAFREVERLTAEIKYMKSGCEDMSAEKAAALRSTGDSAGT